MRFLFPSKFNRALWTSLLTMLNSLSRWEGEACVGNVGAIPRLNFPSLCMQDSPLGIRFCEYPRTIAARFRNVSLQHAEES